MMVCLARRVSSQSVLINGLIITRLLSMKTAKGSSSLVDKFLFLTMESM